MVVPATEALFIGGRSGVGKSSDGAEIYAGSNPRVTAVLLTATDATARQRLARREIGSALQWHIGRSDTAARELNQAAQSGCIE